MIGIDFMPTLIVEEDGNIRWCMDMNYNNSIVANIVYVNVGVEDEEMKKAKK